MNKITQINKLKQENKQLRLFLHEIINLAYRAVNKDEKEEVE